MGPVTQRRHITTCIYMYDPPTTVTSVGNSFSKGKERVYDYM